MKKILSVLALSLIISSSLIFPTSQIYAAESTEGLQQLETNVGSINLNDLDSLGDGIVERKVSYEEAISSIAQISGITVEEARATHPDKTSSLSKNASAAASSVWLSEFSIPLNVTPLYVPTLKIYAYVYSSGSFYQFNELFDVQIDRNNTNHTIFAPGAKKYDGTITAKITNPSSIFYIVNGQFCNSGETTISGGLEAGNSMATFNFSLSTTSDNYAYFYVDGYKYAY